MAHALRLSPLVGLLAAADPAAAQITITDLGAPPGFEIIETTAISPDGAAVVVRGRLSGGPIPPVLALRWTEADGMESLGTLLPGDLGSTPSGVANGGAMVVGYSGDTLIADEWTPFRWTRVGGIVPLPTLPGSNDTAATGVSADGTVVVGTSGPFEAYRAVRWTAAGLQTLPISGWATSSSAVGVSPGGLVVAGLESRAEPNGLTVQRAVRWVGSGPPEPLVPPTETRPTFATAADDGGVVVGYYGSQFTSSRFLRWAPGEGARDLGIPSKQQSGAWPVTAAARGVGAGGRIVVGSATYDFGGGFGFRRAALWAPAVGLVDLTELLAGLGADLTGITLDEAVGVSADGTAVALSGARAGFGRRAFLLRGLPAAALACYANCDLSAASPALNALDFSCFLARYRQAQTTLPAFEWPSAYANCDGSTTLPALNALDFSCFLSRYRAGCP